MHKQWSRNELLVAFKLYCILPFGKFHSKNPEIIKYAHLIGRTQSSLARKLCNLASLDPVIMSSGRKGLTSASSMDKAMWKEMTNHWESFFVHIENIENSFKKEEIEFKEEDKAVNLYESHDKDSIVKIRVGQSLFRKSVLSAYEFQCCISGLSVSQLLVASHIVPWSEDTNNRLNPSNGLCLSVLHDKAFDLGLIGLDENLRIIISPTVKQGTFDKFLAETVLSYEGKKVYLPKKFQPSISFIEYHRNNIFKAS